MILFFASLALAAQPPAPMPLWPDGAPGKAGDTDEDKPSLTLYRAAQPNGTVMLVCPGGGYRNLAMDHEGKQIAAWFNQQGVTAVVLKYRLGPRYHHPAMLYDARQAMRTIRAKAAEWNIRAEKVGVMGFSAGGHLASTISTHFTSPEERPDFSVLVYPVIDLYGRYTHRGSRQNLLGDNPDPKLVELLSNHLAITKHTPPAFLFHTDDDAAVPSMNSVLYYQGLKGAGIPAELHIYAKGRHGVGLAPQDPILSTWPARLQDWMRLQGYLPAR